MTDILSQSHGTLNSVTDDSSTPSNQSEYFSVTSSLDILNCTDEVYYSMDEEATLTRRFPCSQIIIQNIVDFNEDVDRELSLNEIPESENFYHEENGDWDKLCDSLNICLSRDSISTEEDEDDTNNFSTLSESVINTFSVGKQDSDIEEDTSMSGNNVTQMTNSVIEGELSELNDIVYESSLSQDPFIIKEEDDQNVTSSLCVEEEEQSISVHEKSILEMVRKIEFSELNSDFIEAEKMEPTSAVAKEISNDQVLEEVVSSERLSSKEKTDKTKPIEVIEDSPVKTSSLCCSIKRRKGKKASTNLDSRTTKSRSLFSFLKFYKRDRNPLRSPKSLPELNEISGPKDPYLKLQESGQYCGIPFIDADVGFYSDAYIPLARQEVFCE